MPTQTQSFYYIGWANTPNAPFVMDHCPRALRRLSPDQRARECSRADYLYTCAHSWRHFIPPDLYGQAAQLAIDIEWPGIRTPYDRPLAPEEIFRLDCAVIECHADLKNPRLVNPATVPGPRWAGAYAKSRRQTLAKGQPWYGAGGS